MSTGEYIDSLLDEIEELKRERDLYMNEGGNLLKVVFDSIETQSYINPWGVFKYLKALYPNRFKKKMESLDAQDD